MKYYYCLRCKTASVTDPSEANCPKCKVELAEALAKRKGWWRK